MQEVFEKIVEKLEVAGKTELIVHGGRRNGKTLALGYAKGISEAIEIVKQAAAEYNNYWIPCSERMPEESLKSVIGWDAYSERCCFVQYVGGRFVIGDDTDSVNIVAWQPLPEPYQPVSNDSKDAGSGCKKSAWRNQIMRDFLKGLS